MDAGWPTSSRTLRVLERPASQSCRGEPRAHMEVPSPLVLSEERLPALFMELERIAGLCGEVLAEVRAASQLQRNCHQDIAALCQTQVVKGCWSGSTQWSLLLAFIISDVQDPSPSRILGTLSRFSEDCLGRESPQGGSPGVREDPPGTPPLSLCQESPPRTSRRSRESGKEKGPGGPRY